MVAWKTQVLALAFGLAAGTACAAPLVTPAGPIDVGGFELTGNATAFGGKRFGPPTGWAAG